MGGPDPGKVAGALDRRKKEIRHRLHAQMKQEAKRLAGPPASDTSYTVAGASDTDSTRTVISEKAAKLARLLPNKEKRRYLTDQTQQEDMAMTCPSPVKTPPEQSPRPSSSPGALKTGPSSPGKPGRLNLPPARAIADVKGIMQDAWRVAHEDLAESMKEKEWEMRKRRALQDMLREYEQARRQEIDEERRVALVRMSTGWWKDRAEEREKVVLDLQHDTTRRVRKLQQEAHEAYLREVEAISARAKAKAAEMIKQLRATKKLEREALLEARRKELLEQRHMALEETERRLAEEARDEVAKFREALGATVDSTTGRIEEAYHQHLRDEHERGAQACEARIEGLRRETVAAEEERLHFLKDGLEKRLRQASDEAKARVAAYVQKMFPRPIEADPTSQGGLGDLPCLPLQSDESDDDVPHEQADAEKSSRALVNSEVVRWLTDVQVWLDSGCEKLSVAVGELGRERAVLMRQSRSVAETGNRECDGEA